MHETDCTYVRASYLHESIRRPVYIWRYVCIRAKHEYGHRMYVCMYARTRFILFLTCMCSASLGWATYENRENSLFNA